MASGRGRLSSMDILPPEADEHVVWALAQLRERKLLQSEILDAFNLRLAMAGIARQISPSAFNRKTMRLSRQAVRLEETREIAAVLATKFEDGADSDLTVMVSETIKALIFETLERCANPKADVATSEMLGNLANALKAAESAKTISVQQRVLIEAKIKKQANAAIDAVGKAKGLTAATVEEIKAGILGMPRKRA